MSTPPHYSPCIEAGDLIFTSGQLPIISRDPLEVPQGIKEQAELVLRKVEDLLKQYGLSRRHIIKTTAYIEHIEDWYAVNEVYASFFGDLKPARSIIPVSELHFGCLIELEAIASKAHPIAE